MATPIRVIRTGGPLGPWAWPVPSTLVASLLGPDVSGLEARSSAADTFYALRVGARKPTLSYAVRSVSTATARAFSAPIASSLSSWAGSSR